MALATTYKEFGCPRLLVEASRSRLQEHLTNDGEEMEEAIVEASDVGYACRPGILPSVGKTSYHLNEFSDASTWYASDKHQGGRPSGTSTVSQNVVS
jgi:hypothetical protein